MIQRPFYDCHFLTDDSMRLKETDKPRREMRSVFRAILCAIRGGMNRSTFFAIVAALSLAFGSSNSEPQTTAASSDPRIVSLQQVVIPIRSIEPLDDDFSDLEPLGVALAEARVVLLGEANHGDGKTFLIKNRLIRYLHQKKGFDVLAFESGLYECRKAWQRIREGEDPAKALRQSVFGIWTRTIQFQPLIDYFSDVSRSARPLILAGIDPQFTGEISQEYLLKDLSRVADAVGLRGDELVKSISSPLTNLIEGRYEMSELPTAEERTALIETFATLEKELRRKGESVTDRDFWLQWLAGIDDFAEVSWRTDWKNPLMENPTDFGIRDRIMGENLIWLARGQFPDRKIIVWLHSFHGARGLSGVEVDSPMHARLYKTSQPAGAVAHAKLGKELYSIAFVAYHGQFKNLAEGKINELVPPTQGSLEDLFHHVGHPYAFLDLSSDSVPEWLQKPMLSRPIGYLEMRARWREIFDGLIFLEKMTLSEKVPKTEKSQSK